jgi:hypothetical protein
LFVHKRIKKYIFPTLSRFSETRSCIRLQKKAHY